MSGVHRSCRIALFALSWLIAPAYAGSQHSLASAWKQYYNPNARYCVSYPARWYKADAFDGSGLYVMTGTKKHSRATGEIDIAFFANPAGIQARAATISLKDDFDAH